MAKKRAKTLSKDQFDYLVKLVQKSEHPLRDEVALRLSYYAGLRAGEIANLRWKNNLLDAQGKLLDHIHVTSDVGKRAVERRIPLDPDLAAKLKELRRRRPEDEYVFYAMHNHVIPMVPVYGANGKPKKVKGEVVKVVDPDWVPGKVSPNAVVQWFKRLYAQAEFEGCSSHSGRRTFITARARLANLNECSIKDVQDLAGHRRLETTGEYIDPSPHQARLVSAWN